MVHRLLLVEGEGDKEFFEKILERHLSYYKTKVIEIKIPTEQGIDKNGKENVRKAIIKYIAENSDKDYRLACIIDADYINYDKNNAILSSLELYKKDTINLTYDNYEQHKSGGYYLRSNDGLSNVGLWFMPNNKDEGMFEDWLLKISKLTEHYLINYAKNVCTNVNDKRFKEIHFAKAQVGVWTSLQESPHLGTENIILRNLYDENSNDFQNFINWLKFIYE